MAPREFQSFVGARIAGDRYLQFDLIAQEMSVRLPVLAPLLAVIPGVASAEPMTFNAALERAAANAPSVRANEAGVEATRSAAIAAGRVPDSTLSVASTTSPSRGRPRSASTATA